MGSTAATLAASPTGTSVSAGTPDMHLLASWRVRYAACSGPIRARRATIVGRMRCNSRRRRSLRAGGRRVILRQLEEYDSVTGPAGQNSGRRRATSRRAAARET